ncbi:Rhomboid family protein [Solidesulfovibrio fructosivorans JJ]]|uniref:Rhomboid family protein n=1 Tax=Solidesulfovibrio fructosivorans JJ] TaxID=596151 RepID=E1JUW3_SOLFR|nr:rhomboid family intramembrane serine protease [Solidesulfovibrio fructosivorans]EFL51877.1 Rhomboid family protein [Solidesulfovibrio fructosivorans JJ]]
MIGRARHPSVADGASPSPRRPLLWPRPGLRDLTPDLPTEQGYPVTEIRARDWTYVLTARGIPHALRRQDGAWRLYVPRRRAEEALAEIRAYLDERENVVLPDPEAVAPTRPPVVWSVMAVMGVTAGLWGLLLGDATLLGRRVPWKAIGGGDTASMLAGQWWRAATALCLHADPAHLFGNVACAALFLSFLCRETGLGLGLALTVAAGVGGNVLKACVQGPGLYFLGASTAVFGALGALGGVRLACPHPGLSVRRFLAAGAVLMLLAMLGAGSEDTGAVDLAGHLFGFASGAILGLAAGWALGRVGRPGRAAQTLFGLVAAGTLLAAWGLAVASLAG